MGAAGLSASTVAGGALAGASGAVFGSPVQGMGNAMYFGDAYSGGHFLTDVLAGGVLGGVAGGVAGWIKNAKNVRNGGQPGDIWGFGRAGKGQGVVEWGELKLSRQQDGFDLNYANPSKNRPPIEGLEYLDEGVRSSPQAFNRGGNIALGVREYLGKFAKRIGGSTWESWGAKDFESSFMRVINDPSNKIHFNLDGVDNVWSAVSRGAKGYKVGGFTNWELFQLYNSSCELCLEIFKDRES